MEEIIENADIPSIQNKKDARLQNLQIQNLLKYLGLAKKSGAVVSGIELTIEAIRKQKARIVFYSEDISEASLKRLKDKSSYYHTEIYELGLNMEDLGKSVGLIRPAAAVCVTDRNFIPPIKKALFLTEETERHTNTNTEVL